MISHIKKILLTSAIVVLFALYAVQERSQSIVVDPKSLAYLPAATRVAETSPLQSAATLTPTQVPSTASATRQDPFSLNPIEVRATTSSGLETVPATMTPSIPTVTPTATQSGTYVDGTYAGTGEDAHWGTVDVLVTISDGVLKDIQFTEYPNHRNRSQEINNQAMPELIYEAIQAQSADVDIVSGATDTSRAFIRSLDSALQQAAR